MDVLDTLVHPRTSQNFPGPARVSPGLENAFMGGNTGYFWRSLKIAIMHGNLKIAQMHGVNNELFADKSKMNIVLEPRDKHIIVLMTTTKLYMHTKVARHFETNPNMQMFVQILPRK